MNAQEARTRALQARVRRIAENIEDVSNLIASAVEQGLSEVEVDTLYPGIVDEFKRLGYGVSVYTGLTKKGCTVLTIRW